MPGRRVEPEPEAEQADHVPTDTKDMTYFWSNSGQHIQQFMKGFKENNGNDAVHHHSEQRLQAVRCAALLFSPHTSRGPRTRLALHSLCPLRRSRAAHAPPTSRSQ